MLRLCLILKNRLVKGGSSEDAGVAKEGADVAKSARHEVEKRLGQSVVSQDKAIAHIKSPEELPFPDEQKQGQ